jgi:hypothetical protein
MMMMMMMMMAASMLGDLEVGEDDGKEWQRKIDATGY